MTLEVWFKYREIWPEPLPNTNSIVSKLIALIRRNSHTASMAAFSSAATSDVMRSLSSLSAPGKLRVRVLMPALSPIWNETHNFPVLDSHSRQSIDDPRPAIPWSADHYGTSLKLNNLGFDARLS